MASITRFTMLMLLAIYTMLARPTLAAENNIITFKSVDETDRTVMFTASVGKEQIAPVTVGGGQTVDVVIPHGWVGNYLAVGSNEEHVPGAGVIGEVTFNGFEDKTFFDVSAIDDPDDQRGVRMLWPAGDGDNDSGCEGDFPCGNAYTEPNDPQTKVTLQKHLIAMLGRPPAAEAVDGEVEDGDDYRGGGHRNSSDRDKR